MLMDGPLGNRRCTDFLFLLIFIAFAGAMGWICSYGLKNGKPDELLSPVDYDGELCGIGDYKDYPNLYYVVTVKGNFKDANGLFDLEYSPVCIDKCPIDAINLIKCKSTSKVDQSVCSTFFPVNPVGHVGYGTIPIFNKFCLPDYDKLPPQIDKSQYDDIIGNFGLDDIQEAYEDIIDAKWSYLYSVLSCLVVAVIYNILLAYFANILIWVSIVATGLGILALAIFLQGYHTKNYGPESVRSENVGKILQVSVYILYGICGIFFCAILCMWNSIAISVAVLKTSSTILIRNIRMLFIPFICFVAQMAFLGVWLYFFGYLLSCANIIQPEGGSQLKSVNLNDKDELKWQIAVFVFGFFWVLELISAIFQYIIIVGVC